LEETFGLEFHQEEIEKAIQGLIEKYQDESFAFELIEIAEGYQFLTKGAYHNTVGTLLKQRTRKRLSRAALETLAIVAYRQPVSKTDIEKIRGVNSDYAIQKLLEKELVSIVGRSEGPGKPLLYGAGDKFMNYFGLKSIKDLPQPKEFKDPENLIGEPEDIEEPRDFGIGIADFGEVSGLENSEIE
jgi:segregation and condensation protein B